MVTPSPSSSSVLLLSRKQDSFVYESPGVSLYRGAIASGKTIAGAVKTFIRRETFPNTVEIVGGPSWDQLRDGTMRSLDRTMPDGWTTYRNDQKHIWRIHNGSELIFRTLDDPDVLRSLEAHDLWIDEIAMCAPGALDIGIARLRLPAPPNFTHEAWGTTTPRGTDWTLDVWGQNGKPGYPVVHSTIYDNRQNLPEGYIERLEEKYRDTPFFAQELLGEYTAFEGLVYPMFSRQTHVKPAPCPINECTEIVVGVDWGGVTPTAMTLLGKRASGGVHQYAEFYRPGATLGDVGGRLHEWCELARLRPGQLRVACDGSEPVAISTLAEMFDTFAANKERETGIKYVQSLLQLQAGGPTLTIDPSCPNTISEYGQYVWASRRDASTKVAYMTDTPIDHHADAMDACFVAGTMIEAERGSVAIQDIRAGERVLTRDGYRRVQAWARTNDRAKVYTVILSNGRELTGTGNHPVRIGKRWVPLAQLRYGDILTTCESVLSLTVFHSTATADEAITTQGARVFRASTKRLGRPSMGRSPQAATSTTSTATTITTRQPIFNASLKLGTTPSILASAQFDTLSVGFVQRHIAAAHHDDMIDFVPLPARQSGVVAKDSTMWSEHAVPVDECSRAIGMIVPAAAPVFVRGLYAEPLRRAVYNLTVEDVPEYFANGALVHNCRYGLMELGQYVPQEMITLPSGLRVYG